MTKQKIQITRTFDCPLHVAFEVEFDTETGEAEVVSSGRVVSHPESKSRREIVQSIDLDELDTEAYRTLLDQKCLPRPEEGDTVMLHGKAHHVDPELYEDVTDKDDLDTMLDCLVPVDDVVQSPWRTRRPRSPRRHHLRRR